MSSLISGQVKCKSPDMHEQLQKLAEMKEKRLLSEEEFNSQKARLLHREKIM
jgi:hypothetical protein